MGDRAYNASSNPNQGTTLPVPPGRTLNGAAPNGAGAGPKPVPAGPTRVVPQYRPKPYAPPRRRSSRCTCCKCCMWLIFVLLALCFLAAISAGVMYVLYHPRKPSFNVTSLRLSAFNISQASDLVTARLDLTVTARNPNQKISFSYGDVSISAYSNSVDVADGSIPAFVLDPNNVTVQRVSLSSLNRSIDPAEGQGLAKRKSYPLEIVLDTKAGVKIGRLRSFKIAIRVSCTGVTASLPKAVSIAPSPSAKIPSPPPPVSIDASCTPKIKILSWTF